MACRFCRFLPVLLTAALLAHAVARGLPAADDSPGVRLVVLVVFDQLRGDSLPRWEEHFGEGGFRRLMREGAVFDDCHYPFAATFTATGHASLATGCSPDRHGIVGNEWVDRKTGALTASVASTRYDRVPASGSAAQASASSRVSPELLKAETLADVLKQSTEGKSRIVSLSLKDRSAILLAGKGATACYWFDEESGLFVTSQFYARQLHPWVESFNRDRLADSWFDRPWTRFRDDLDYASLVGPDRAQGEAGGVRQGVVFPHPTNGGLPKPGPAYYAALTTSPYGNELLLVLALRALETEKLGTRETADMLCLSFSSNDAIGHSWGPDSQEVFDAALQSDIVVEKLLEALDEQVGKDHYLLVLTSDHGICPLPEVSIAQGKAAGRVSISALQRAVNSFLEEEFGKGDPTARWIDGIANHWVYLNQAQFRRTGIDPAKAQRALAGWLSQLTPVEAAYTATELQIGLPADDELGARVARSYSADRCGDVLVVLKPLWVLTENAVGAQHGSPHDYDTHVPFLVVGPDVIPGRRAERISPTATAAIFADRLGIRRPNQADTEPPEKLFQGAGSRGKPLKAPAR